MRRQGNHRALVGAADSAEPPLLLVTSRAAELDPRRLSTFLDAGFRLRERYDLGGTDDEDALHRALSGAWGVLAGSERYSRALLDTQTTLKVIARCGVGLDTVDVQAASERGMAVLTTPGANTDAVADFTLTLMLACLRQVRDVDRAVRDGTWRLGEAGRDLTGTTVALIGAGAIGQAVARRLRGFGCRLLGVDPFADQSVCDQLGIKLVELDEALRQADVLTIHTPLTDETRQLIGARELSLLPRGAVIVNTARGGVLDEAALLTSLRQGHLWAAGLDVFTREPLPPDDPLGSADGVVLAGHIAAYTRSSIATTLDMLLDDLVALRSHRMPRGCINVGELWPRAGSR